MKLLYNVNTSFPLKENTSLPNKVELDSVLSGYGSTSRLNANFDAIELAFNRCVFRDGTAPNFLSANLDLNGFELSNIGAATVDQFRGNAGTVAIGAVTTIAAGGTPTVTNTGTSGAAILNFGLVTGNTGPQGTVGATGSNASNPAFSVATGTAGTSVILSGTYPNLTLTIPRGDTGGSGALGNGTYSGIVVSGAGTALDVVAGHITYARMTNAAGAGVIGATAAGVNSLLSFATVKTNLVLVKADVGLSAVDNTADTAKPVSTVQQTALNLKANLAGPTFTGVPVAPTAAALTATTQLATTEFVDRLRDVPVVANTGSSRALVLTDRGQTVPNTVGGWVIPANASVAFPIGSILWLYNSSGTAQTVSITTDTLRLAGSVSTGSRTVAVYGLVILYKTAATEWLISGNAS